MKNTNYAAVPVVVREGDILTVTIGDLSERFDDCADIDATDADTIGDVAIEMLADTFGYAPDDDGASDALADLCERLESAIAVALAR